MTDAALQADFAPHSPVAAPKAGPTRLPKPKIHLLRAFRAFRRLLADKEDTQQVFEIMQALNGRSTARGYRRLLTTAEGGRLAYRRVELNDVLNDPAYLDRFQPGTVGAAYRDFMRSQNLSAEGLAEESRKAAERRGMMVELEHPMAWFGRRIRDTHDIWHTLTGYGRDGLGEVCLVAFSYAQTRSLGWAFIALGGCIRGAAGEERRARRGRRLAGLSERAQGRVATRRGLRAHPGRAHRGRPRPAEHSRAQRLPRYPRTSPRRRCQHGRAA